jgi:hypothetical protein
LRRRIVTGVLIDQKYTDAIGGVALMRKQSIYRMFRLVASHRNHRQQHEKLKTKGVFGTTMSAAVAPSAVVVLVKRIR